jgi:hypothetical protein
VFNAVKLGIRSENLRAREIIEPKAIPLIYDVCSGRGMAHQVATNHHFIPRGNYKEAPFLVFVPLQQTESAPFKMLPNKTLSFQVEPLLPEGLLMLGSRRRRG